MSFITFIRKTCEGNVSNNASVRDMCDLSETLNNGPPGSCVQPIDRMKRILKRRKKYFFIRGQ
jgi:hypothetical protein